MRVDVEPRLVSWARERAGLSVEVLSKRFPRLHDWESGVSKPTLKQLESFAGATHAPFGMLLLTEPPVEVVPIPDFRTLRDTQVGAASPDLLDTIYQCEQRQEWFRTYAQQEQLDRPEFVSTASLDDEAADIGASMRRRLDYEVDARRELGSWAEALRHLSDRAEQAGVLVMVNGVVGSNTHRTLDPEEFRGFALVDDLAPVVFINGADTKAAQIFTLAHELAHIWLGGSAVGNATVASTELPAVERWCNEAAAELLVPREMVASDFIGGVDLGAQVQSMARRYRVSGLVILRRIRDVGLIDQTTFMRTYQVELQAAMAGKESGASGGNFYNTTPVRASKRFTRAVIESTLEGRTLHRDAFAMLGFKKASTFDGLVQSIGLAG